MERVSNYPLCILCRKNSNDNKIGSVSNVYGCTTSGVAYNSLRHRNGLNENQGGQKMNSGQKNGSSTSLRSHRGNKVTFL